MNSTEVLGAFREEMRDQELPHFWSDAAIYRYLDDAQTMFCRLTEGIEDSSTGSVCRVSVTAGTEWLPLSQKILKVRSATSAATGRPYEIMNMEKAPAQGVIFDGRSGYTRVLVAGFEKHKLRAWPKPDTDLTVDLQVFRLPLQHITDVGGQALEIDEQHHTALLLWMKHLAYNVQDSEAFNKSKAEEFEARFRSYCFAALKEQERARRTVGAVLYGGL